jgi:hypothetical protein
MSNYNLLGHYFCINGEILECINDEIENRFATFRNIYTYDISIIRKEFVIEDYEYLGKEIIAHNMMRG